MATKSQPERNRTEQFTINPTECLDETAVDDDTPEYVLVELSPNYVGDFLAVIAAGEGGHYSLDFAVADENVVIGRAYEGGEKCTINDLPRWMHAVVDELEHELN